ncbi:hypothetical protein ID11_20340 (plasmid) [Pantoea vagans]|nr:hypothetical protein ID11_20340 [Pantoea vagans]
MIFHLFNHVIVYATDCCLELCHWHSADAVQARIRYEREADIESVRLLITLCSSGLSRQRQDQYQAMKVGVLTLDLLNVAMMMAP